MTRRDLTFLLPALTGVTAVSSEAASTKLPSTTFAYESLPVKVNGENKSRAVLDGLTHTGFAVEMHETELAPGMMPHPPHHHDNEEMLIIREGTMEVTIGSKVSKLGPGSVAFVASGEEHGWKNVGTTRAKYFVLALGKAPKA